MLWKHGIHNIDLFLVCVKIVVLTVCTGQCIAFPMKKSYNGKRLSEDGFCIEEYRFKRCAYENNFNRRR